MISAVRFLGPAAACATLLIAGALAEPASAQGDACKADIVTATGRGKFRPFTKTKELEGRGSAMADAVANWEREVGSRFGEQWKTWAGAKGTTFNCAPTKTGKIIGSSFIGCTISGRPCATTPSAGGAVIEDDIRGPGARDRGRRLSEEGRAEDRAYRRAMAFQDRLAAERRRAEARALRREEAHQRYLARERGRTALAQGAWEERLYRHHRYDRDYYDGPRDYSRYSAYGRYREYPYALRRYGNYHFYDQFILGDRRWSPEDRRTGGRAWWRRMDSEGRGGQR